VHDNAAHTEERIDRFVRERVVPAVERRRRPLDIEAWEVPDEPVPFAEAAAQEYAPFTAGTTWSRPWGTTWFHVTGEVPNSWGGPQARVEVEIDLGFTSRQAGFQAEGLVYRPDGSIVKGIEPLNNRVSVDAQPGSPIDFYVEAAANPDIGGHFEYLPTHLGDRATAGDDPVYTLRLIDVVERHRGTEELVNDCRVLVGLMRELDPSLPRRAEILRALERMCDVVDPDAVAQTSALGREALAGVLAAPAYASAHRIVAVGHAHIDSAWLWPVRETVRKCARTFSNVLALMDEDPSFVFACSSAQQYAWMKEFYPGLFERIRERVAEGRFVPVGGMWVESDTNMPGGEAMVRQFLLGKGFFMREFGVDPTEVWLPDSFGYSAALPQIARGAGCDYFLTQKTSWNDTNPMPHHTFLWEGIDGTRVLTHFPPTDTYNSDLSAADLARAQRQYAEKGWSNVSMTPFGYGDGGGGPTREMLAAASRTRDLEGSPKVVLGTPRQFFEEAAAEIKAPSVWSGEMYLELHRGTYTSQARTKRGNRRSEHLLREAELWSATAAARGLMNYPYDELTAAWETVLLQQFHDILPGSSIAWVHQQAEQNYERVARELTALISAAQRVLAGEGDRPLVFNAAPVPVDGVPPMGSAVAEAAHRDVTPQKAERGWVLDNGVVRVFLNEDGLVGSFVDLATGREVVAPGQVAGLLQVFRDTPNQWDAWDIDVHYRRSVRELRVADSISIESAALVVTRTVNRSMITQRFSLAEGRAELAVETRVDWHERQKMLKLAFPVAVHADRAASEIQFGHVNRPTHSNTSWDVARFETVAHRWVHVAEPGFGVVVANAQTYGHDITRRWADDGSTYTLVRQSLVRAPLFPDPTADQGQHVFRSTLGLAPTVLEAVDAGYRLNLPTRSVHGSRPVVPLVKVSSPAVIVEAVKLAEDRSGDLIVRLYEAAGGRAQCQVTFEVATTEVWKVDLLERDLDAQLWRPGDAIDLCLRPFEILTLRVRMAVARDFIAWRLSPDPRSPDIAGG